MTLSELAERSERLSEKALDLSNDPFSINDPLEAMILKDFSEELSSAARQLKSRGSVDYSTLIMAQVNVLRLIGRAELKPKMALFYRPKKEVCPRG